MDKNVKRLVSAVICVILGCCTVFADDTSTSSSATAVPYSKNEFPGWANDLRRTEIITFGSLPFVVLDATIVYSFYRYAAHNFSSDYVPNPLAKTSDSANLDSDEQVKILGTSALICLGLGLTDLTINFVRRAIENGQIKRRNMATSNEAVIISTVTPPETSSVPENPPENIPPSEAKE